MRKLYLACAAAAFALLAPASHAAAEEAAAASKYAVWVDALNLREGPSSQTGAITVLRRGDVVTGKTGEVYSNDGSTLELWMFNEPEERYSFWRKVRIGNTTGWVADRYILPARVYEAFREADIRARKGDAGMLAAIKSGNLAIGDDPGGISAGEIYTVSPDGQRIFVTVNTRWDWKGDYPEDYYLPSLVLYFAAGQGLAEKLILYHHYGERKWSSDSRFFACTFMTEEYDSNLALFDAVTNTFKALKPDLSTAFQPPGYYNEDPFEFVPGYIVWFGARILTKPVPAERAPIDCQPVLTAYELETGKIIPILEADMTTTSSEVYHERFCDFYKVKMAPAGPCPPAVKDSGLYREFSGGYGYAWTGSEA